jgi:hypothetical protein
VTTVLIHHRVADYDAWKREYDRVLTGPLGNDVRAYRVWRGQDDPDLVVVCEAYESRKAAELALAHPALPGVMASAGVDTQSMRIEYLDEIACG